MMTNMYDGIFFINHALKVNQLSVYSEQERFEQTIDTLSSIHKYCSNNKIFIFDSSPEIPNIKHMEKLQDMGASIFYNGNRSDVNRFSSLGQRSIAETITFLSFLEWFYKQNVTAKRIYKLSGRYQLNDNFVLNDDSYVDSFVFANSIDSWMSKDKQDFTKVNRLFKLRLWHMDFNLLNSFNEELKSILNDCYIFGIDVEHSYYKNLHKYKTIELDKIGVCGNIAPSGEYIDE